MKKLVFLSFLFILCIEARAQQDPMLSQYMFNNLFVNPGSAGISNKIDANLLMRQQWVGFEGAPKTQLFSIQSPIEFFGKKHGLGLTLIGDNLGFDKNFCAELAYSYHLEIWGGDLGIGSNFGLYNKSLDASGFKANDANDQSIPTSNGSDMSFDLGFGAFYKNDKLYAGLSMSHILQPDLQYEKQDNSQSKKISPFYLKRHYFLTAGYEVQLPNPMLELTPSVMFKSDLASYQATFNARVTYNKRFWGGLGYRWGDAVVVLAGLELVNNVKIGYAYDMNVSKLRTYNSGSHEIMLTYSFTISTERIPQKYKSVRFL